MNAWKCCLIVILPVFFVGCSDFLEEQSEDEVRPSTIIELQQLLNREGYPSMSDKLYPYIDLLTDDSECFGPQGMDMKRYTNSYKEIKDFYLWSDDMFKNISDTRHYNSWEVLYHKILGCNLVLAYIDRVEGDVKQKMNLKGQALGLRGYYYLILTNLYGQPYGLPENDSESSPGVPLMLSLDFSDVLPLRNTVKEVYDQVEQDLFGAIESFEKSEKGNKYYQMSIEAVHTLLSRVYLYKGDWDNVLVYCDKVLSSKQTLTKLILSGTKNVFSLESDELIWHYAGPYLGSIYSGYGAKTAKAFVQVSDELVASYKPTSEGLTDLRLTMYYAMFNTNNAKKIPFYGSKSKIAGVNATSDGIRVSEVYLNRVEACIQKFIKTGDPAYRTKALSDLNYLRSCRFDTKVGVYVPVDYTDGKQLMDFYKGERRRELCFEGLHRWCDLRRWGMPSLSHAYIPESGPPIPATLKEGDPRYVLLIPEAVREQNYLLKQNPR